MSNPYPFAPVYEKFPHFDREERSHIHRLVGMHGFLSEKQEKTRKDWEKLRALTWVLTILMELEDATD